MNAIFNWGTFMVFVVAVFKVGRLICNQFIWSRDRKSQLKAAAQFKKDNEPVYQLADNDLKSLARVFWKESLNGFEFFIPGVVRQWLYHNKPESIDIVFYQDVAIFVGSANAVDLFEESQTSLFSIPDLKVSQTAIEMWHEAPADCADFDAPLVNGGRLIRAIDGERMVLFKDENPVNGHLFIIGASAFFSLAAALFGTAILLELGPIAWSSSISFSMSFPILLCFFWVSGVIVFNTRQRLKFKRETKIFFDRKTSKAYLKKPGAAALTVVPWDQLNVRVSAQGGYLAGTPYSIRDNKLEFFATDDRHHTNVEFCATSLAGGLGVWKAVAMFMNRQIDSTRSITPWGLEYRKGDPHKDGLYLLKRRIKTTFPELSFTAKALHVCLFFLTFGPLPYVIAARTSDSRASQAFRIVRHH